MRPDRSGTSLAARVLVLGIIAAGLTTTGAWAGGNLETVDITGRIPSPRPGEVIGRVVGIHWDSRCLPITFRVNDTLDPIPNPLGKRFLHVADALPALTAATDVWNRIPTSFVSFRIDGTVENHRTQGFDMINEMTFRTPADFDLIASTPIVALCEDSELVDGEDLDEDGDPDVVAGLGTCRDADGDGDIEFPAGFYRAGTILDADIQFNTKKNNGFRFTVEDSQVDTEARSVDLEAIAAHELGHAQGLSHTLDNQLGPRDGTGATMFPFIDTGDPVSELSLRRLEIDDVAWSSLLYPEGTAFTGPAALGPGDIPFDHVFALVRGEATQGRQGVPLAGGSVFAVDLASGRRTASALTGTTRVSVDLDTGNLDAVDAAFALLDGRYSLPLPFGFYRLGIEAVDGFPVPASVMPLSVQVGQVLGQQDFEEEFWNGFKESADETEPGSSVPVPVLPGGRRGIDFVTDRPLEIANFGNRDRVGNVDAAPGSWYAVRVPASQVAALTGLHRFAVRSGLFFTFVADRSTLPRFAEAALVTGRVLADGTARLDLARPLARATGFLGQDDDFAPFYFPHPRLLGDRVRLGILTGHLDDLFLALRVPTETPFPGASGLPPLIGKSFGPDGRTAGFGLSYTSVDGVRFLPDETFDFLFALSLQEIP